MKKFLAKICIFIVILGLFFLVPVLIISSYDIIESNAIGNRNLKTLRNKNNYDSLDILFVGNSYSYSSINPIYFDSLNISSFNIGIATAGVFFYELLINDYLQNVKKPPEIIFLLITPMTFSSKSDDFISHPIHRYLEDKISNFDIVFKYTGFESVVPLYKRSFKKGIKNIFKINISERQNLNLPYYKGHIPSDKIINDKTIKSTEKLYLPFKNDHFNWEKVDLLIKIAENASEKDTEIVFFQLPTNLLDNYFSSEYLASYNKFLLKLKKEHNLILLDSGIFSEKNYRNIDHMNSSGAKIATNQIIHFLHDNNSVLKIK